MGKNKNVRKRGSLDEDINTGTETILSQARKIRSSENLSTDSFGFEFYYMKRDRQKRDELYAIRRADLNAKLLRSEIIAKQTEIQFFCENRSSGARMSSRSTDFS